jgi:predicted Fe-Mo cluster-binding NifX family protein
MRIAIPVAGGKLAQHFGHCEQFALFEVDNHQKTITGKQLLEAPPHQPGLLPVWLADRGANIVIAGGMGQRAQSLFSDNGITVVIGASSMDPENIVSDWLNGALKTGDNICDH